jgi:WD40 repeat protein
VIWRIGEPGPPQVLRAGTKTLLNASFSPDGTRLVTAERGTQAKLWDLESERPPLMLQRGKRFKFGCCVVPYPGVEFSPNGDRVLMVGSDGGLRLWDDRGRRLTEIRGTHNAIVNDATFSPDGRLIAAGTDDAAVLVLDARTGERVAKLDADEFEEVASVAFNGDSTRVIGQTSYDTTHVWDVRSRGRVAGVTGRLSSTFYWAAFSTDGGRLAMPEGDHRMRIRTCIPCLSSKDIVALADSRAERELTDAERKVYRLDSG